MKIAVLLSGPRRYAPLVLDRLRIVMPDRDYGVFVHVWQRDEGGKARGNFEFSLSALRARAEVVYLVEEPGFQRGDFPEIVGASNSGSPPHNTMGMFLAIMHLAGVLRTAGSSYTHVLRLRTDCLLHGFELPQADVRRRAWVADNPVLPREWICDHLWWSDRATFFAGWDFGDRRRLVREYLSANRNPERLLARRARQAGVGIERSWRRWVHYSIVYARPVASDPACLQAAVRDLSPTALFAQVDQWHDVAACEVHASGFPIVPDHLSRWNRFKQWMAEKLGRT